MKGERIKIKDPASLRSSILKEKNPDSKIKLVFLNLVNSSSLEFENICEICGIAASTGYSWIRDWNENGYESIREKEKRGGRPPKLSPQDLEQLDKYLRKRKSWQIKEVRTLIKSNFRVDLSEDQIARILKEKLKRNISENSREIQNKYPKLCLDIFEDAGIAVSIIDLEERITFWNKNAEKQFGWKSQKINGKELHTLMLHPGFQEEKDKIIQNVFSGKSISGFKSAFLHQDGNRIEVSLSFLPTRDANMNTSGVLVIIMDISQNIQIGECLKVANEELEKCNFERNVEIEKVNKLISDVNKLKTIIDFAPEAIVVTDTNFCVQLRNPAADKLYAGAISCGEKFENNEHIQFYYPDCTLYNPHDLPLIRSALYGETQSNVEITALILKDGKKRNLLVNTVPIKDDMDKLIGAVGIFQDISEGKKTDELRHENDRLISTSKARSDFLTIMSHELRTPLTSVIGYSILLKEENPGRLNRKQELIVDNILSSSKHLLNLINGILDLAKIESGKLKIHIEEVSPLDIINETLRLFEERAEKKNIILKKEIDPELTQIMVDRQKFRQILFNLIGNAIKFSKEKGGIVTVSAQKEIDNARISVSDTGIGIRERDMPKLFQRFEQLDSGITRRYDGAGLGLAITKQLVEQHGGKIWVESRYGEGSKFIFMIPLFY